MKASLFFSLLTATMPLLATAPLSAQETTAWTTATMNGVEYISLNSIQSFYKLSAVDNKGKTPQKIIRNSDFSLGLTAGQREITISGYRVQLSVPVLQDEQGELYISETDFVKVIDPILRPTYITERREIKTVIIDPGHGGADQGNKTPTDTESAYTLKVATELAESLKAQGFNVVLTRNGNYLVNDAQRVELAKNTPNALFISLHLNAGRSDMAGIETYTAAPLMPGKRTMECHRHDATNMALAFALHTHLVFHTKAYDRACRRAHYTLLNTLNCPSAMVLLGYTTNEKEATDLATDAYRAAIVKSLTGAIVTFRDTIRPGAQIVNPEPIKVEPTVTQPTPPQEEQKKQAESSKKKSEPAKKQTKKTNKKKSDKKSSTKKYGKSRKRR